MSQQKKKDAGITNEKHSAKKSKKSNDKEEHASPSGPRTTYFQGYDLKELDVPEQALPFESAEYKGKHSYTVSLQGADTRFY